MNLYLLPVLLASMLAITSQQVFADESNTPIDELKLRADERDPSALTELGRRYEAGDGVVRYYVQALEYYERAAFAGGTSEKLTYANRLVKLTDDIELAYTWANIALSLGVTKISKSLDRIEEKLDASVIHKAQRSAFECVESNFKNCGRKYSFKAPLQPSSNLSQSDLMLALADNDEISAVGAAMIYIQDEVRKRWVRPADARNGMEVELRIRLVPTGEVVNMEVTYQKNASKAFVDSVQKAVNKVGRFDKLAGFDHELFDANFRTFKILFRP